VIEVTTTRTIDLVQLADELGTDELAMRTEGDDRTVTCFDTAVTAQALQAAVDAHVPAPPPAPTLAELQAQLDEIAAQIAALQA
jgi:hypothetical protein